MQAPSARSPHPLSAFPAADDFPPFACEYRVGWLGPFVGIAVDVQTYVYTHTHTPSVVYDYEGCILGLLGVF